MDDFEIKEVKPKGNYDPENFQNDTRNFDGCIRGNKYVVAKVLESIMREAEEIKRSKLSNNKEL